MKKKQATFYRLPDNEAWLEGWAEDEVSRIGLEMGSDVTSDNKPFIYIYLILNSW